MYVFGFTQDLGNVQGLNSALTVSQPQLKIINDHWNIFNPTHASDVLTNFVLFPKISEH